MERLTVEALVPGARNSIYRPVRSMRVAQAQTEPVPPNQVNSTLRQMLTRREEQHMDNERDKPHEATSTAPQGAALGETVKAGLDRAGAVAKDAADKTRDALAGYREGGVEKALGDLADCVRTQPISALLVAMGVGLFLGVLLGRGHGCDSQDSA